MKKGSIGSPNLYLGNKVSKITLENGTNCWSFSSAQYVHSAVNNVEQYLRGNNESLPKNAKCPFKTDYRPELDISSELTPKDAT